MNSEDKELSTVVKNTDKGFTPQSTEQIFQKKFNFDGTAKIIKRKPVGWLKLKRLSGEETLSLIDNLHSHLEKIEKELKEEIRKTAGSLLPENAGIELEIVFKKGSLEFLGFVSFLTFENLGKLADTIAVVIALKDIVKYTIEKIVRNNTPPEYQVKKINTNVREEKFPTNWITKFLWWCAGAKVNILEQYLTEKSEISRSRRNNSVYYNSGFFFRQLCRLYNFLSGPGYSGLGISYLYFDRNYLGTGNLQFRQIYCYIIKKRADQL